MTNEELMELKETITNWYKKAYDAKIEAYKAGDAKANDAAYHEREAYSRVLGELNKYINK